MAELDAERAGEDENMSLAETVAEVLVEHARKDLFFDNCDVGLCACGFAYDGSGEWEKHAAKAVVAQIDQLLGNEGR